MGLELFEFKSERYNNLKESRLTAQEQDSNEVGQ